jgi:leucyl aminopeptidase
MHVPEIVIKEQTERNISSIFIAGDEAEAVRDLQNEQEAAFVKKRFSGKEGYVLLNRYDRRQWIVFVPEQGSPEEKMEKLRQIAFRVSGEVMKYGDTEIQVAARITEADLPLAFLEGLLLSFYRFDKYFTEKRREREDPLPERVYVSFPGVPAEELEALKVVVRAVEYARDLVNEPVSWLNAVRLSEAFVAMGHEAGFSVEVFHKQKIEAMRMGGLLAVNRGSVDPPTFTVMEWKPENAVNDKPVVLVGKGVVFDTGGLSLKPTKDSMDQMKSDMAGAAAAGATIYALAAGKVPCHVIALVPATDNRPDGNAYAPGDVVTMYDGTTVEVLNTDAEGRMILADALAYAKRFDPQLVIELSTLTGAAAVAIGKYGIVGMGTAPEEDFSALAESGERKNERVVRFPFWDEYNELLKSEIADMKNIGGREAGAITAGKFLEHFTSYPYIHLDIAGPAFVLGKNSYKGKGGTGVGVRLLTDFLRNRCKQ